MDFDIKPKKKFTPAQAYLKAQKYCAYQERCQQEVRNKLYEWGLYNDDIENIIANLIGENFINEERFAKAFAGGKFRIKKWGKTKIKAELKKKKISEYCIRSGLNEIKEEEYLQTLTALIHKKITETKKGQAYQKNFKAAQYVISKGFESDLVWDIIKQNN